MIVDTHLHVIDPARYPLPATPTGYRPQPDDVADAAMLLRTLDDAGVNAAVLVQASGWGDDNRWVVETCALRPGLLRGMIGVAPGRPAPDLARPDIAGLRLNAIDGGAGDGTKAELERLLGLAGDHGKVAQLLATPELLAAAAPLLKAAPCAVLLDHLAGLWGPFARNEAAVATVLDLAAAEHIHLKLSAPFRATPGDWGVATALARRLLDAFGPERCVWGSDWPFIKLRDPSRPTYAAALAWGREVAGDAADAVFGTTPVRLFGFAA